MSTLKSGLRYPPGGVAPNVAQDLKNLAEDLDFIGANYASTSARNAANPTPSEGDMCRVAGRFQIYRAGQWNWIVDGADYLWANASANYAIPGDGTWTILPMAAATSDGGGGSLTRVTNGITVGLTGIYRVDVFVTWTGNTSGFRGLGAQVGAAQPSSPQLQLADTLVRQHTWSDELALGAGQTVSGVVQSTAGGPLNVTFRSLKVRRVA